MKVAMTGTTGLVGSRVSELQPTTTEVVPMPSAQFDLFRPDVTAWAHRLPSVDAILHLAADTAVDAIEKERPLGETGDAYRLNVHGTEALAHLARNRGIPLVLVSTDFVFPANASGPFPEESPETSSAETSWYGWTKLRAEAATLRSPENTVLRISYPYRGTDFPREDHARRIVALYRTKRLYPLFTDQFFTPTFIDDCARALYQIVDHGLQGIYHCAPRDRTTPWEFGQQVLKRLGLLDGALTGAQFSNDSGRARRPREGGLATAKARKVGLPSRTLRENVETFATQLQEFQAE